MAIEGKTSYVFSGDDDQTVVVPLPLAFIRLIASGVYTYDIRWYDDQWMQEDITSAQLAIIEGALATMSQAIDGVGAEVGGMVHLPTGLTVYSQSGTNSNPPQIQILKATYPELEEATLLTGFVKSTLDLDRWLTMFKYGSATNQWLQSLPAGSNRFNQVLIPVDDVGAKVNVSGFDTLAYWTIQITINGYWK